MKVIYLLGEEACPESLQPTAPRALGHPDMSQGLCSNRRAQHCQGELSTDRGGSEPRGSQHCQGGSAPEAAPALPPGTSPWQRILMGLQVRSARLQRGQRRPQVNYSCCTTALRCRERLHSEEAIASKCLARVKPSSGCSPRAQRSTLAQLFLGGGEKHTSDPKAAFRGSQLQEGSWFP